MSLINLMGMPLAILPAAIMFFVQVCGKEMLVKISTHDYCELIIGSVVRV